MKDKTLPYPIFEPFYPTQFSSNREIKIFIFEYLLSSFKKLHPSVLNK